MVNNQSQAFVVTLWCLIFLVLFGGICSASPVQVLTYPGPFLALDKSMVNDQLAHKYGLSFPRPSPDTSLVPLPPYPTNNPANRGPYSGPCPVGSNGAPQLRETGLSSQAQCRGACGINCPAERCSAVEDRNMSVPGGFCIYRDIISCSTNAGCIDHDACYDYCTESLGQTSMTDDCHMECNYRCFDEFGLGECAAWADIPGSLLSSAGYTQDMLTAPSFAPEGLYFSDEPDFYPAAAPSINPTVEETKNPLDSTDQESDVSGGTIQIPNILQGKPKVVYTANDFMVDANNAASHGLPLLALADFNKAEEAYLKNYPDKTSRPADVDSTLATIENSKARIYHGLPNHQGDEIAALQNAKDLQQSANSKEIASDFLPGFGTVVAILALGIVLMVFRKKQ